MITRNGHQKQGTKKALSLDKIQKHPSSYCFLESPAKKKQDLNTFSLVNPLFQQAKVIPLSLISCNSLSFLRL